jgi:DNA repair/transcription protein MET18/MMS19
MLTVGIQSVRMVAVQCLNDLIDAKPNPVQSIRTMVLKGLQKVLDDPKRLVRREAVNCRARWFMLNQ